MIALLLTLAQAEPLPAYPDALRCASLTAAAFNLAGHDSKAGNYDAVIFWGMALSERARKDGLSAARFEQDHKDHTERAEAELRPENVKARAELKSCYGRVPKR